MSGPLITNCDARALIFLLSSSRIVRSAVENLRLFFGTGWRSGNFSKEDFEEDLEFAGDTVDVCPGTCLDGALCAEVEFRDVREGKDGGVAV